MQAAEKRHDKRVLANLLMPVIGIMLAVVAAVVAKLINH